MPRPKLCLQCGTVGPAVRYTKGSFSIELILWCLILLPGLLYQSGRAEYCFSLCVGTSQRLARSVEILVPGEASGYQPACRIVNIGNRAKSGDARQCFHVSFKARV